METKHFRMSEATPKQKQASALDEILGIRKPRMRKKPVKPTPVSRTGKKSPPKHENLSIPAASVSGPVWTYFEVSIRLGTVAHPLSHKEIARRIENGLLLSLPIKSDPYGAFPIWQFVGSGKQAEICPGLPEVLNLITTDVANRWTLASWLQQSNKSLDGRSPLAALREGDREAVLHLAKLVRERWSR